MLAYFSGEKTMNPYINAIMGHSGSMALDAELDYILGEDFFDEGEEGEGSQEEDTSKGEEQEDFFDEGESEEEGDGEDKESEKAKAAKVAKAAKAAKAKLLRKFKRKKGKKGKKGKRVKRIYTKRERKQIAKLRKKIRKKRAHLKAGKWVKRNRRLIDDLKIRIRMIRDRARRRYLNKRDKGSKNEMIHLANPFALKESAVIRGMAQQEQDAYIRNKSISNGVFMGALAAGFYTFWKREESAEYVLQNGTVISKDEYYENEEYLPSRLSHTEKESWKDSFMEDPKMTGGIFAAATAIGTFWANSNLKRRLKEE